MPSPTDYINDFLRKQLQRKQREREVNMVGYTTAYLDGQEKVAKTWMAAVRRNDKSIALLVSKLICEHDVPRAGLAVRKGVHIADFYRCTKCKAAVTR